MNHVLKNFVIGQAHLFFIFWLFNQMVNNPVCIKR